MRIRAGLAGEYQDLDTVLRSFRARRLGVRQTVAVHDILANCGFPPPALGTNSQAGVAEVFKSDHCGVKLTG
jgi:hypothetical protein